MSLEDQERLKEERDQKYRERHIEGKVYEKPDLKSIYYYKDYKNQRWKNPYHHRNDIVHEVKNRENYKQFNEYMEKAKGRTKLTDDIKSKDEIENEIKQKQEQFKNKNLTFWPKLNEKIYSIDAKRMVPRPKSQMRMTDDVISR